MTIPADVLLPMPPHSRHKNTVGLVGIQIYTLLISSSNICLSIVQLQSAAGEQLIHDHLDA